MSSYYSEAPVGVDLMLQNVLLATKKQQLKEQNDPDTPKNISSPSSSSESRKTISFEGDGSFSLQDINITVPKVMKP